MRIQVPERLISLMTEYPWGITEAKAQELLQILDERSRGIARSDEEIRAAVGGRRLSVEPKGGGVAVLPIFGVIAPRMDSLTAISGGTSVEKLRDRFDALMANEDVGTIVLHVDSPGGNVQFVPEFAARVFEARGDKRIVAIADGMMASAAYWIGSAAEEIWITPSGMAGSIGVFQIHTEISRAEDAAGITRTIIRAGKYKAEANPHEPLSEEAREHLQATVDEFYGMFVEAVARHRGVAEDDVRNGLGQGRSFAAVPALQAGLVDRIGTLEDLLGSLGVRMEPEALEAVGSDGDAIEVVGADSLLTLDGVSVPVGSGSEVEAWSVDPSTTINSMGLLYPSGDTRPVEVHGAATGAITDGTTLDTDDEDDTPPAAADVGEAPSSTADTAPDGEESTMPKEINGSGPQDGAGKAGGTAVATIARDHEAEQARADEIIAVCKEHGVANRITEFMSSGLSAEQVGETIRLEAEQNLKAMTASPVELTEREVRRYSLCRAIMGVAEKGEAWDGFEREVSDEIRKKLPKNHDDHGGIFVPVRRNAVASDLVGQRDLFISRLQAMVKKQAMPILTQARLLSQLDQMQAALDTGTATAGQELLFTEAGDFIDLLRARMKVAELGATILTGLQGNVAFPKQDGAGTFSWVAEDPGSDLSDSDLTLTQVALNAATGMSTTAYSRQLLNQGVVDVDMLVKNDLALITALGIDLAGIAGSGASNQPTGILNTSGIGDVDIGATGGAPTYEHMVDLETDVATANADIGAMAYLTTPGVRGKLKKTEEFATSNGRPVWTGGMEGEVNGYPAHVSTQVPSNLSDGTGTNLHAIIFGVWSQLIIGYWGAYELVVDPYSKKKQALIELTSYQQAGIAVRHPASFSAVQDADPTA